MYRLLLLRIIKAQEGLFSRRPSCAELTFELLLITTLIVPQVQATPQYGTVTVSKVISVYDGYTFRVNIDSLPPIVGKKCSGLTNCSGPLILDTFQATFSNSAIF